MFFALTLILCFGLTACGKASPSATGACTVVFYTNGGSEVRSQKVDAGEKIKRPPDPTRSGMDFVGWYTDIECLNEWDFATDTVDKDTVLFAKWKISSGEVPDPDADEFTVTFVTGGGSAVPAQTVAKGGKVTRPPDPTRVNKKFGGWYADAACDISWNFAADTVTENISLYAKWIDDPTGGDVDARGNATVTFNVGLDARKSGLSNPPVQTVKRGGTIVKPEVSRTGYTLSGWYVEDGDTAWDFATDNVNGNVTLFARWRVDQSGGNAGDSYDPPSTMRDSNTLYVHYLRNNADTAMQWNLWVWLDNSSGRKYSAVDSDKAGVVFEIDLSALGNPSSLNFKAALITSSGAWQSEDGGDVKITLSETWNVDGSYHWFVRQGNTANGTKYFVGSSSLGGNTENLRESINDVNRADAKALPVFDTATTFEETGVGYQIFVASFCDSDGDGVGDLRGIIQKLDYLESLNVDVLWLTPVQSSNSYHGYDCYDYYSIDKKFGTNADYRELVYKAHARGMKIIMDLVVNHTSPNNEWFIKSQAGVVETVTYSTGKTAEVHYRDFYRWSNRSNGNRWISDGDGWYFYSSFGGNMPELNYDCQAVRDAMIDVAAYWMSYGLDGFRMDAIKHVFMADESVNDPSDRLAGDGEWKYNLDKNVEFFKEMNYRLKSVYPQCFLLGEQLDGNADNVAPFYAGMDSLFDFNTYYNLPSKIKSGDVSGAAYAFGANAANYARFREDRAINSMISSNHDVPRLSSYFTDKSQIALYLAVMMTSPGLSWIYYGDEIGLKGPKPTIGENDSNFRQSMKWTEDWENECRNVISDKNHNLITDSVARQSQDESSLLSYVRKLTKLRHDNPELINGSASYSTENGMLKISIAGNARTLVAYHNFTSSSKTVDGNAVFGTNTVGPYGTTVVSRNV